MSSRARKQTKRRMEKMNRIPQQMVDPRQATEIVCPCGSVLFDKAYKLGHISKLAAGNLTGKDLTIHIEVYVCRKCGAGAMTDVKLPEKEETDSGVPGEVVDAEFDPERECL
ncbi:MAG: hypothetical protein C4576_11495 [Desulfobacteraceae bacterium]|nr:MAG: hypothetical protein C4576_11495 [Desulfobacteraceae bacterium]